MTLVTDRIRFMAHVRIQQMTPPKRDQAHREPLGKQHRYVRRIGRMRNIKP